MQVLFVFSLILRTDLPTYLPTDRDCSRGPSGPKKSNPSSFCSSQLLVKYLTSVFSSAVSVLPDYQEQARQRQRQVMRAAALTNIPTLGQF